MQEGNLFVLAVLRILTESDHSQFGIPDGLPAVIANRNRHISAVANQDRDHEQYLPYTSCRQKNTLLLPEHVPKDPGRGDPAGPRGANPQLLFELCPRLGSEWVRSNAIRRLAADCPAALYKMVAEEQ
jgi:hypothetical protein